MLRKIFVGGPRKHNVGHADFCSANGNKCARRSDSSWEICRPVITLGQVLGLLSWDLTQNKVKSGRRQFSEQACSFLYKMVVSSIIAVGYVVRSKMMLDATGRDTSASPQTIVHYGLFAMQTLFTLFVLGVCLRKETCFWKLLKLFDHLDSQLETTIQKKKIILEFLLYHCTTTVIALTVEVRDILHSIPTVHFPFLLGQTVDFFGRDLFACLFFTTAANLCTDKFAALNKELTSILSSAATPINQRLYVIRLRYEQLYRLASCIQGAFAWLITAALARHTIFLCCGAYMLLFTPTTNLSSGRACLVFILLVALIRIFSIAAAASNITAQVELGLECLQNIKRQDLSHNEQFQVLLLVAKFGHSPIRITAALGLFTVSRTTFTTIVSTIITYLVVLVQFPSEKNNELAAN